MYPNDVIRVHLWSEKQTIHVTVCDMDQSKEAYFERRQECVANNPPQYNIKAEKFRLPVVT